MRTRCVRRSCLCESTDVASIDSTRDTMCDESGIKPRGAQAKLQSSVAHSSVRACNLFVQTRRQSRAVPRMAARTKVVYIHYNLTGEDDYGCGLTTSSLWSPVNNVNEVGLWGDGKAMPLSTSPSASRAKNSSGQTHH